MFDVCKFVNLTPWALFGINPTFDDDDPEDEDDSDDEESDDED